MKILARACLLLFVTSASAAPVDFTNDVKPILSRACFECHGAKKQRAGLRLDTATALREGGNSGPVVIEGDSKASRIILALTGADKAVAVMPPKGDRLRDSEIAIIRRWIDEGAKIPTTESATKEVHWSFRPVVRHTVPTVKNTAWVRTPIDAFILSRLEAAGTKPSPEAGRNTQIRRLYLDMIGLPPTPKDVEAFINDSSPDAYDKLVDRLLASPHYGERWGRHWLDLARYADSNGYSIDAPRTIWPYRDWVINAINAGMPYDRFTIEQLAGDLLPNATIDQKVATGFHRNTQINQEGGIDPEQFRIESIVDRVNTTGSVWLGLTIGCCQCHNHKFDPLRQKEYYQLFAFFNNQDEPNLPIGKSDTPQPQPAKGKGKGMGKDGRISTMVLSERATPRSTSIMIGGDFTRLGAKVSPGTPAVLPTFGFESKESRPANRLDLAKWIVAPENPLTARVAVNRIWMHYFGIGLVETENDYGTQGTPPSHPELLDWLASEFVRLQWSEKEMHRLILGSAVYRQSSNARPDLEILDPRNRLLGRAGRPRLEAELVRDVSLAASGLLSAKIGGPSVFPPQPDGVGSLTQVKRVWTPSEGPDRYRRGMYTHFWRGSPHPSLTLFDAPDAGTACTRRNRSNTPLQALSLLNDVGFAEYSYGLAARLLREPDPVRQGFQLCLGREPTAAESQRLTAFLEKQEARHGHPVGAKAILDGGGTVGKSLREHAGVSDGKKAALVLLCRVLLNLDEFITRE